MDKQMVTELQQQDFNRVYPIIKKFAELSESNSLLRLMSTESLARVPQVSIILKVVG